MTETTANPERRFTRREEEIRKATRRGGGALLDIAELAAALGESERTIRTWRASGMIPTIVLGYRSHRFRLPDVMAALERRTV
jgi:Helix-turn-helix domain